jgi:hypothetical protein
MSAARLLLLPVVLGTWTAAMAQGLPIQKYEQTLTFTNRTTQLFTLLASASPHDKALPAPTPDRLGLRLGAGSRELMALELPARQSRTVTLVLEYKWVKGQSPLVPGFQLKDGRADTVLWALAASGPKVVASEFSAGRALNPAAVKVDGATVTLLQGNLGR